MKRTERFIVSAAVGLLGVVRSSSELRLFLE
jgi:hypothetical protein